MQEKNDSRTRDINWPIVGAGALLGLMLSWSLLGGNEQGLVNILYLLLIYLVIPVASVVLSVISLLFGKGINLARLAVHVPIWSRQYLALFHWLRQRRIDKYWFFLQSQAAALGFSCGSLLVFFLLLLATDVNFVWRSTLLDAQSLLPFLRAIALPWRFWQEAQPDLALLQATRDSRLIAVTGDVSAFSRWWPFILATQVCYSLLLRTVLLTAARAWLAARERSDRDAMLEPAADLARWNGDVTVELAPVTDQISAEVTLVNWAGVEDALVRQLAEVPYASEPRLLAGPLATEEEQSAAERWPGQQLLLVKAWEPPMGELADYMRATRGYLLPLDWHEGRLCTPRGEHLDEWRYFVTSLEGWRVYQPASLGTKA